MSIKIPNVNIPGWVKTALKLLILGLIIFLVIRKIDEKIFIQIFTSIKIPWILWALVWFAISKAIAAMRFNTLMKTEEIQLTTWENMRLYWLCMYYNLLLPGGISGDGYKIKVLMDRFDKPLKRLFSLTLLDRLSGMIALGQLALLLFLFIPASRPYGIWVILAFLLSFFVIEILYKIFRVSKVAILNTAQSFGVQGAQAVAALGLVWALHEQSHLVDYLLLFLISSLVAMVPISIGGAGAREITFLYGAKYLAIDPEKAVAMAFMFYLISTLVSFFGIVFSFRKLNG